MYRRRLSVYSRRSSLTVANVIVIGIIVGVTFLLFDRWRAAVPAAATPTPRAQPTLAALLMASPQAVISPTPEPQARLFIPSAGVNAQVVDTYLNGESWDVTQLGDNAGHLQGTAWFGSPGNIALAGHVELADGRAGIFAQIDQLTQGDPIILMLGAHEQRYSVTAVLRVAPDDLRVLYPTTTDQITLITCDSYNFLQNTYQERVVVVAERVT
jgi:sortase A